MSAEREQLAELLHDNITDSLHSDLTKDELRQQVEAAVDVILTSDFRKPFDVIPGLYRNRLGAEIEVNSLEMGRNILGGVWNAHQKDDLFPRHLLVTADGLRDSGYSRVQTPDD